MVRVRFAPSPTGNLHIGSVRTALFNWLFAKNKNGIFVLRIEDTDMERSTKAFELNIFEGMKWMGLLADEGPNEGGHYPPYRQSERIANGMYRDYAEKLLASGYAYYCFCTEADLESEKKADEENSKAYTYSKKCSRLTADQVKEKLASGVPYTIRFRIPENAKQVIVPDLIRGDIEFDTTLFSDFIIMKSDGSASYNYAVVVDDLTMNITHVIRGEDHISNTPRQMLIFKAFGAEPPKFAHLPIILGPDKSKLSKRHGAKAVTEYRDMGYLPEALLNYLSLLGWTPRAQSEVLSEAELCALFKLEEVSKSGSVFDEVKLRWMNGQYIRKLSTEALEAKVKPYISPEILERLNTVSESDLRSMILSIRDNLEVLSDIDKYLGIYAMDMAAYQAQLSTTKFADTDMEVLRLLKSKLEGLEIWVPQEIDRVITEILDKLKFGKGKVFKPIRLATSGVGSGPHLPDLISLLGKERVMQRLDSLNLA